MLSDCRKGRIDKVLVKSISRFARNTKECLESIRELKALGISVFFEEHNIDTRMVTSEMLTAVLASCAQAESESISKNMKWSYQKRMLSGTYIPSSVPYGYGLNNKQIMVEPDEAVVVVQIFTLYLAGYLFTTNGLFFHGKEKLFAEWGYTVDDARWLQAEMERQVREKYLAGEHSLGKLNLFGQRINITIEIPRKNGLGTVTFVSGWRVEPGGKLKLNTPYGGK